MLIPPPAARPLLICLDLQREFVTPGRPLYAPGATGALRAAAAMLEHARAFDWPVMHVHSRGDNLFVADGNLAAPIAAFRPRIEEPLYYRRGLSAFSEPAILRAVVGCGANELNLIGFSLSGSALATGLHAADLGLPLTPIVDALAAAPASGADGPTLARAACAILSSRLPMKTGVIASQGVHAEGRGRP